MTKSCYGNEFILYYQMMLNQTDVAIPMWRCCELLAFVYMASLDGLSKPYNYHVLTVR